MEQSDPVRAAIEVALRETQRKLRLAQDSAQRRLERERELQKSLHGMTVEVESLRAALRQKDEELRETRKRAREEQEEVQRRVTKLREAVLELQYKEK